MIEINGKSVYNALGMGKLYFYKRAVSRTRRIHIKNEEDEINRFRTARDTAICELQQLYERALADVGEEGALIFQIHQLMLEDEDYCRAIESEISTHSINCEYAICIISDQFAAGFSSMDDEYMQARAADVNDICTRLINIINETADLAPVFSEPVIIVADDLSPSETIQLDKNKILGFVTFGGSQTSHTAILARTMNIPAIIDTGEIDSCHDGEIAILDGHSGILYINPDEDKIADYKIRKQLSNERQKELDALKGMADETKSGQKINIYANIGSPEDVDAVLESDAGGIGLFRSEFIYLEKNDFPTEEEQFLKYKEVAEKMNGKKVIIRTLDIGADKKIDYFNLPNEENPALGYRAIRICLGQQDIFKIQLRAILRASAFGNLSIMFPMIISVNEVRQVKAILEETKSELRAENIPFNENIETGIMIETPAAAIICDMLAPEVDFFSIGTNDLTQYTLAIDRQNHNLEQFYDPHHPAILRLIKNVTDTAHRFGKWVGICGELGSDLSLTQEFLRMGMDELSVSPSYVLKLREKIRNTD